MTNHIEQLMKAAGVKKMPVKGYPLFTPSKQLELIKLIAQKDRGFHSVHFSEWTCESCHSIYDRSYFLEWTAGATFEEALARLLILLIKQKHLKKKEVRRILEDG